MGATSSSPSAPPSPPSRQVQRSPRLGVRSGSLAHYRGASPGLRRQLGGLTVTQVPQIRCYQCHEVFHSRADLARTTHHCRCPYCSAINGVPAVHTEPAPRAEFGINVLAATRISNLLASLEMDQQEQLLRRLQSREISPLELLILRGFVEHLQQNRNGANAREIEACTASWTVEDVKKLPEELRSCCVCLEEVCQGNCVRTLPCFHTFHSDCAIEWLKKKKTCPLCQFAIDGGGDVGGSSAERP